MIGFQGPESERLLQELVSVDLSTLRYYAALRRHRVPPEAR